MKKYILAFFIIMLFISIFTVQPKPSLAAPDLETLDPNASGDYEQWDLSDSTHYGALSDVSDSTYIYTSTDAEIDIAQLTNTSALGEADTIDTVTYYMRAASDGAQAGEYLFFYHSDGVNEGANGARISITTSSMAEYSQEASTAPDGGSWTKADLDSLQMGVQVESIGNGETLSVAKVWIAIDYTAGATVPEKPVIVSPENENRTLDTTPTFIWENGANTTSHRLVIDDSELFDDGDNTYDNANAWDNVGTTIENELSAGTWYWKVAGVADSTENWSENTWILYVEQWNLIESWTGTVRAPTVWNLIESWNGTVQAPASWSLIETWSGEVKAPASWNLIETWTGTIRSAEAYVWNIIETWSGTVRGTAYWNIIESWTGTMQAPAYWNVIESWSGTINSPAYWNMIESWSGTISAPIIYIVVDSKSLSGNWNNAIVWIIIKYDDNAPMENVSMQLKVNNDRYERKIVDSENKLTWENIVLPNNTDDIEIRMDNMLDNRTDLGTSLPVDNLLYVENTTIVGSIDDRVFTVNDGDSGTFTGLVSSNAGYVDLITTSYLKYGASILDSENYTIAPNDNESLSLTTTPTGTSIYNIEIYENTTLCSDTVVTIYVSVTKGGATGVAYVPPTPTYAISFNIYNPRYGEPAVGAIVTLSADNIIYHTDKADEKGRVSFDIEKGTWLLKITREEHEDFIIENLVIEKDREFEVVLLKTSEVMPKENRLPLAIILTGVIGFLIVLGIYKVVRDRKQQNK